MTGANDNHGRLTFPKEDKWDRSLQGKGNIFSRFLQQIRSITASTEMINITHYEVLYSLPDISPLRFGRPGL
jgi:hypothetical protein